MSLKASKGWKRKADLLFSEIIRSKGYCENCGRSDGVQLQTAHIISRRYAAVRTDTDNAFCLCAKCHRRFTDFPREFSHFITDKLGSEKYDQLSAKALPLTKVNWEAEYIRLKKLKERV